MGCDDASENTELSNRFQVPEWSSTGAVESKRSYSASECARLSGVSTDTLRYSNDNGCFRATESG